MAKQVSISLKPKHIRIVKQYGKETGIDAFSTALQSLIEQFDKRPQPNTPKNGHGQLQPATEIQVPEPA